MTRIEVGPLTPTDLGAVLAYRLGYALPRPRVEALARASDGNPMFTLALARLTPSAAGGQSDSRTLSQALAVCLQGLEPSALSAAMAASASLEPSAELLLRAGVDRAGI